jgi:hypothetical protein
MSVSDPQVSLGDLGNVSDEYAHYQKVMVPGPDLVLPNAYLKWYEIRPPEMTLAPEYIEQCRELLRTEAAAGRLTIEQQLGFVLLHRCARVDFLIICTWFNDNELWETVYVRDLSGDSGFDLVRVSGHRPTFCVWELGVVCHESAAWARYLASNRDEQAKLAYITNRASGLV